MDSNFHDTSVSEPDRAGHKCEPAITIEMMHTIGAARLKPGASLEAFQRSAAPAGDAVGRDGVIRGRALIFWDLKVPGKRKKLDAIDTEIGRAHV